MEFQEIPLIPKIFSLEYVHNPGAAFGILRHQQWLFITITMVVVIGLIVFAFRKESRGMLMQAATGCLLGGAIGNMIDRMRYGEVVDFFKLYWKTWIFPNFNVADLAITVGVGLLILHVLRTGEKEHA
jgi:signal peptidase II